MKKRILSIVLAICMVLTFVPITVFADSNSHTVTVNAGEGGKVSTDGENWTDSVEVAVNDGETLDGKVQYKADEGYEFDGVIPKIVSVAGGQNHTVLLDAKGNVWTAGRNNNGQLGRKTSSDRDSTFKPVTVGDGVKIKAIAAGIYHTVLLDANGNVWTAGSNNSGQLGRTDSNTSSFTQVTNGISGVKITAIAAGYHHTVLLDEDCNVWTAGFNSDGQLGRTDSNTSTFTQVTTFDDIDDISRVKIKAIAAGYQHTVLLDEDNNVWTAGSNSEGQLGRTGGNNSTFTMVTKGIIGVNMTAIASGGYHTVLLDKDGNVWTAGHNRYGQLGRVTSSDSDAKTFTKVTNGIGGVNITAIAAGSKYTVLLDKGGNVWTAGDNFYGGLGRDTSPYSYDQTFTKVTNGISGVTIKAIAAGSAHTVLLDAKGSVWTAGYNEYGQLGRETNSDIDSTFKQATVSPDAITFDELINIPIKFNSVFLVKFRAKDYTVTVNAGEGGKVSTDGTSWSNSVEVAVNDGETLDGKVQYKADEGYEFDGVVPKIVSVAGGSSHTVLLDANGNVWTAGLNLYGQLGRDENGGTNNSNPTFTQVTVFDDIDDISKVKIKAIAAGDLHTVLLDEEGNVWTAGWNSYGQLGRDENSGTNNANPTFTQVTVFDDIDDISKVKIKAIAAGGAHTVLLDEDGNVWTAGLNNYGQLGRDENTNTANANSTFTQTDVILNTITFDEFVNIPIHYNSVFIVKFKDIQKPVITGPENGKSYCDTVEFTVTDNDGIASVTANNVELTATNGKYTLEKGKGTVTVVATDNSGNTAEVTVTVNNGHTWNNGVCSFCGYPCSHDYDSVVTPPTCTESGYTTHTCANCGNIYVDSEVPATGHSFKFFKCVNCGMHYGCKGANCVICSIVRWFNGLINSCEIWLT